MGRKDDLDIIVGADETAARKAYGRLCSQTRGFLDAYLIRGLGIHAAADREDVLQTTFLRVWEARTTFRNRGITAFRAFLKSTAYRAYIDLLRGRGRGVSLETLDQFDVPAEERPRVEEMALAAAMAESLHHLAHVLFLGLDRALSRETHRRQLLAAQLYYLDGAPWKEVVRLLGAGPEEEPPLTRDVLDAWLSHPGVLRLLAYQELYLTNHALAGALIGGEDTAALDRLAEPELSAAARDEPAAGGWTWGEIRLILWRYRSALSPEQILARQDCPYAPQELACVLDKIAAGLPFKHKMQELLSRLAETAGIRGEAAFGTPHLWQRLALQYRIHEGLSHGDIRERMQPAADAVAYTLTPAMLNVWLSGGRLIERLARFWRETHGGEDDDAEA